MAVNSPVVVFGGRYEIGRLIGQGGMGRVYEAHDRRLHREVAIKVTSEGAGDERRRRRFEQEARSAARVNHPNVTAIYDVGDQGDESYIVMERLSTASLADRLRNGPLSVVQTRRLALELLGGLGAAHDKGVLHRDIKPGNILFSATGVAKLADFGVAQLDQPSELTETGMVIGSVAYLPPERLHGQPATASGDIYSLGVVLYEVLAGHRPFEGDTPFAVARAIDVVDPVPIGQIHPEVDPWLGEAIDRAMRRRPEERFANAASMAAALESDQASLVPTALLLPLSTATQTVPMAVQSSPSPTDVWAPVPVDPASTTSGGEPKRRLRLTRRRILVAAAISAIAICVIVLGSIGANRASSPPSPSSPTTAPPTSIFPPATAKPIPPVSATAPTTAAPTREHGHKKG
jgi:serine/threonine protein kinase